LLQKRKELIEQTFEVGYKTQQASTIIHIAACYLDKLLHSEFHSSNLTALTCLLLASKYDELDDNIPLIKEIIRKSSCKYSYDEFVAEEGRILKALNWDLH